MKSKRTSIYQALPMFILSGALVLSGCENPVDTYDADRLQKEAKEVFPVKNIDPKQTWETSAICNASVTINEKAGEPYTIKVYTADPYNTSEPAALLATAKATDGQAVNFNFDMPAALQHIYIMKVNDKGYSSAIPVAIENGVAKAVFGGENKATATTRADSKFFTPEIPGSNVFPTTPPANCGDINKYSDKRNTIPYLLKNSTYDNINPWMGGDLYIQGNVTIKTWSEPSYATNLYLLPNSTLTLEMSNFNHRANSIFSIGTGAKLIAVGTTLRGNTNAKYFNNGTIKAQGIEVNAGYLYNGGTIDSGTLQVSGPSSKVYNATDAKLSISKYSQTDGYFLNETGGVVNCSETTTFNASRVVWENAGHYTTFDMKISGWGHHIRNSCWLTIEKQFCIIDGSISNESYIVCKNLYLSNATIYMAGKSFFEVKEVAKFRYNTQGFIAGNGEYALLKMGEAVKEIADQRSTITYQNNLYVACDKHFKQGNDGGGPQGAYITFIGSAQITGADNANISIPKSECNPGYNSTPDCGGDGDDKVQEYVYAFEDMGKEIGDYDFNDAVLYVTVPYIKNNKRYIDITLKAVGANKQLALLFNKKTLFQDVHEALEVPTGTIVNTGGRTAEVKTQSIEVESGFSLTNNGDFYLSDGKREIHIPNFTTGFKPGNVPYAIRIPKAWKWPKERIDITAAYKEFAEWAKDATSKMEWYNTYTADKVME